MLLPLPPLPPAPHPAAGGALQSGSTGLLGKARNPQACACMRGGEKEREREGGCVERGRVPLPKVRSQRSEITECLVRGRGPSV